MKRRATGSRAFSKITAGLEDAIAYHRGKALLTVRDVELKPLRPMTAKDVVAVRTRMRVSQAAFARILNVSPRTVQAWEADARQPSDAALKLLSVAQKYPEVLFDADLSRTAT
jgi:putative transcriptional regulator